MEGNTPLKHASLFSGIGACELAATWMGWENVFHCEINPFGRQVLNYYWPESIAYHDIKKTDFTPHKGTIDILSGGFPCQPFSTAGKRKGTEDERNLWPEMLRAVREISPRWVVAENVRGLINWNGGLVFDQVQSDLETEGYEVLPFLLPACAVGAPHRRDRIWIVAKNTRGDGCANGEYEKQGDFGNEREFSAGSKKLDFGKEATPNPNKNGLHTGNSEHEIQPSERGFDALYDVEQVVIADTEHIRQSRQGRPKGQSGAAAFSDWQASWANPNGGWPTQPPIRTRNDGFSRQLSRYLIPEFYATISEKNRIKNVPEMWGIVSQEKIWQQIRRLYALESQEVLLQTMQLYQAGNFGQSELSPFSKKFCEDIMRKLSKYGEFGRTPQGQKLQEQSAGKLADIMPHLPHEIPLAAKAFETQLAKFDAWHRKESLMAYGNSMVPQVVLQIFKAIEAYEINSK